MKDLGIDERRFVNWNNYTLLFRSAYTCIMYIYAYIFVRGYVHTYTQGTPTEL